MRRSHSRLTHGLVAAIVAVLLGCTVAPDSPDGPTEPWFEEVSGQLGIEFVHRSGARGDLLFPEIMSGGVALFDADGDQDLDLYFVQGGDPSGGASGTGDDAPNELWRNDGASFHRVTEGVDDPPGYGMGVAAGDIDGDGDVDLFVTRLGADALLRNDTRQGNGTEPAGPIRFTDITREAGLAADSGWSSSAGFFDADGDGDLDLFVVRYVYWSPTSDLDCDAPSGGPDYCSPLSYSAPLPDLLYRNQGVDASGTLSFREVSTKAGLRSAFGNGLGLAFLDFDGDQDLDVFVANDQTPNQLWRNAGDGTFVDVAAEMGCAVDPNGQARAGMGVAAADLDDDGDAELLVVNLERQADTLLRNEGAFFADITAAAGLGALSRRYTRFGVGLMDFDHDGYLDLYLANGRVTLPAGVALGDDPFVEPNLLLAADADGSFHLVGPSGGTEPVLVATSRAAAFGDLDGDGGIDVVVVNRQGRAHVLRNRRAANGHWLVFDLENLPGRSAIGTEVIVHWAGRALHRWVAPASSYQASHDPRVHFGLGDKGSKTEIEGVEVRWPDGGVQQLSPLRIDRRHRVVRR
jgi:hypothetical protein